MTHKHEFPAYFPANAWLTMPIINIGDGPSPNVAQLPIRVGPSLRYTHPICTRLVPTLTKYLSIFFGEPPKLEKISEFSWAQVILSVLPVLQIRGACYVTDFDGRFSKA